LYRYSNVPENGSNLKIFMCVFMCQAQMLALVHCPSTKTFGLAGFERYCTEVWFFSLQKIMHTVKTGFLQKKKTSMPGKLKEVFVRHSASTKY
jgi:hypothetical protein